ncbi:MAG: mandelate racemase/muconate lactonizing enzyme family protein [Pseudomonadota bacterium]
MRISRITAWAAHIPLKKPYFLAGGTQRFESLDSTLIRIDTDEDVSGWGESCPWGNTYLPAHGPGVRAALETIAPALIGADPRSPEEINRIMDAALPGHPYAKSGLDTACWDILGKVAGLPLWQLFGGAEAAPVEVMGSVSFGDATAMIAELEANGAAGRRTHSVKLGAREPAEDIARIEAIDAALPPGERITWDVNCAWTPATAVQVLNATSTAHWVEQPCATLRQCAHVAARIRNPVMLDECLHSFDDHLDAWSTRACEGAKVKPNRVGGLTRARQIRDFGVSVGWRMHIEDLGGCGLADMAAVHLASSTPDAHRLASWVGDELIAEDYCDGTGARSENGWTTPSSAPGHGVELNVERLGDAVAVFH